MSSANASTSDDQRSSPADSWLKTACSASRMRDAASVIVLLVLNIWIAAPLFQIEYTIHTFSIEYAFIAIAERMRSAWPQFTWWREWYCGIPFQNSYPPFLHAIVALCGSLFGLSSARAYHIVVATFYCAGPLTVFWLARTMSVSTARAFLAAVFMTGFSPSAWMLKERGLTDMLHDYAHRFYDTAYYGEGPHTTSMALLPVAIILLHHALNDRRWTLAAAAGLASVVLTNWLGGFALAAAVVAYLCSRELDWRLWLRAAQIGCLSYALASPMIPPSTLMAVRHNAQQLGGDYRFGMINLICLIVTFCIAGVLGRISSRLAMRFAISFSMVMTTITLAGEWFKFAILPQPERYHTEMEIALCLLFAIMLPERRWVIAVALAVSLHSIYHCAERAHSIALPIDIKTTSEYRVAQWFDRNMHGGRVSAPGSISFAMNIWTQTPQIDGGFDHGILNKLIPAIKYQLHSGANAHDREGEVATDWLKALGVHAVAVSGPGSTEAFKPITNPEKFDGKLQLLWHDHGDSVYRIPQRSTSLARAIPRSAVVDHAPAYANMTESLHPYLNACDDPSMPDVSWEWISRDRAVAKAVLTSDLVISIQIAFCPGWTANINGKSTEILSDGLGQMLIEPNIAGPCSIELHYTGGREAQLARAICFLAMIGGILLLFRR